MQLIYQGNVYNYRRVLPFAAQRSLTVARTLFYRGQSFTHHHAAVESVAPKATNWRFSAPCSQNAVNIGAVYL